MKLKEILNKYSDDEILKNIAKLYSDQNPDWYKSPLQQLRKTNPIDTDITIFINHKEDIYGYNKSCKYALALEFRPWGQWLSMEIDNDIIDRYSLLDIITICIWEMTLIEWDDKSIQLKLNKIHSRIEDYKENK